MKIVCLADCHSILNFSVPEADLLLIAGDMEPAKHNPYLSISLQSNWLNVDFRYWLADQPIKECVYIAGNHSWIFEKAKDRVPKMNSNFHYLEDESIELFGLKIYGTPHQLPFNNWAFNLPEKELSKKWELIPDNIDILLCHSPPYRIMDKVEHNNFTRHIGSKSLLKRIKEIKPKIVAFGHNHNCYGIVEKEGIKFINCSLLNEKYKMTKEPIVLEI